MDNESLLDQIEALYQAEDLNLPNSRNRFIKDGIIDQELFSKQKTKILFIAKEHNDISQSDDKEYKADYRLWWQEGVYLQFANRISEWACGLLEGFSTAYELLTPKQKHDSLKSIAFINVKKSSGKASANTNDICQYIIASRSLLQQQIINIAPTLIVCCFRHDFYVELLFANKEDKLKMVRAASNAYSIGRWNNINIINFYHPSARKNKLALYNELRNAYKLLYPDPL